MVSLIVKVSLVLCVLLIPFTAVADSEQEVLEQRIKELTQEAEQTTDLSRLMVISQELMELATQLLAYLPGVEPISSAQRGATPEQEVERQLNAINRGYRGGRKIIGQHRGEGLKHVPLSKAARMTGELQVYGYDYEPPVNNWTPLKLNYVIKETFIGYVIATEFYDPGTGKLTDKKEYSLSSISNGINVSSSGRECVERSYTRPTTCTKWAAYGVNDFPEGDTYPAIHDWVVIGGPEENSKLKMQIETPSIVFRSADGRAARGTGCFGDVVEMPHTIFADSLRDGKYDNTKFVGRDYRGSPACRPGSKVQISMKLCNPDDFAEMDHCKAIKALLDDLKFILVLRDTFKAKGPQADDPVHLVSLVSQTISDRFPSMNMQNEAYLKKQAGGYEICSGKKQVPNLCETSCVPSPLCGWETDGLHVHEDTHHNDVQGDPEFKKLSCDTNYRLSSYPDINQWYKEEALGWSELEYNAYNEQAKFLRDAINEQLSLSSGCPFEAQFYLQLEAASKLIEN